MHIRHSFPADEELELHEGSRPLGPAVRPRTALGGGVAAHNGTGAVHSCLEEVGREPSGRAVVSLQRLRLTRSSIRSQNVDDPQCRGGKPTVFIRGNERAAKGIVAFKLHQ
jgi:hypothetical protein